MYEMKNIKYIKSNEINVLLITNHFFLVCPPGLGKLIPFFTGQWRDSGFKSKVLWCSNIQWSRMGDILSLCSVRLRSC